MAWQAILGILGLGRDLIEAKADLKKAKIEAQTKAVMKAADHEAAWEQVAAQNAQNSYLDELWTGVLLVPLVLAFTGQGDHVERGFDALDTVPEWYIWAVLASVGWAFARRGVPGVASWLRRK